MSLATNGRDGNGLQIKISFIINLLRFCDDKLNYIILMASLKKINYIPYWTKSRSDGAQHRRYIIFVLKISKNNYCPISAFTTTPQHGYKLCENTKAAGNKIIWAAKLNIAYLIINYLIN